MFAIMGAGIVGDELGIQKVGLVAPPLAARMILDPARIDHADPVPRLMQAQRREFSIGTSGLHDGAWQWVGMEFAHPGKQFADPCAGVLKAGVVLLGGLQEAGIEFGLGHINAKAGVMGMK